MKYIDEKLNQGVKTDEIQKVEARSKVKNYKSYIEYIREMPEPIASSQLPKGKLNFGVISKYANTHNICVASLSEEEKKLLVKRVEKLLKCAEERAELEGWIDADHLENELRMVVHRPETADSSHKELNEKNNK